MGAFVSTVPNFHTIDGFEGRKDVFCKAEEWRETFI
jgi:hypothetical protein